MFASHQKQASKALTLGRVTAIYFAVLFVTYGGTLV